MIRKITLLENFWGWQSPAGISLKQPQIATMKEKPSHHPEREVRAQQTCFGRTEERSIKYESDPRTVNFIRVLPLIKKEPGNGRDIIGKISIPAFQIIYPIVKSTYGCWCSLRLRPVWRRSSLINQMVSDRSKTGGYGYRTSRATFLPEGLKNVRQMDDATTRRIAQVCISFISLVWRLSACGYMTLLPPP
ncbi:hypothetical protein YC2023_089223 [Brassica napus]